MKIEPKTLPGFMELLPENQILFNKIKDTIRKNYEKFGFLPLDTPVLESSEVLLAKAGGETEKQIYSFEKGDNKLCMRFDLTVPLAKYVAKNYNNLNFPFKRYQIDKVYRGERPQKGRFREFYQCDIDVIGKEKLSLKYDAEVPSVMYNIFKDLAIGDFTIFISNRKLLLGLLISLGLEELKADVLRMIDKLDKITEQDFISTLAENYSISTEKIDKILEFVSIKGTTDEQLVALKNLDISNEIFATGVAELEEVVKYMRIFGINDENFAINLKIARGLDYYTGTVYETFLKGYESIGSVCSGGRYDNLAEYYTDAKLPGVGMSIGLTRLFYQLNEIGILRNGEKTFSKALIIPMGETYETCIKLSNILRENDINNLVYLEDTKFKNKMQFASNSGIKFAVIIGEDEAKQEYYSLKNLFTFEQTQVKLEELLEILKNN